MGFQTDCTHSGEDRSAYLGSIPPPIYESSLFVHPTYAEFLAASTVGHEGGDAWVYSRIGNPTVRVLERKLALLEGGEDARAFASGMAAISAAVLSAAGSGDHVLCTRSVYANAHRLFVENLPRLGIEVTFADFTDLDRAGAALQPNTRVLYLESPGNPGMHLVDLEAVVHLARARDLTTIIDNTMATPYNQQPLAYGIDLAVHSVTKYLAGHSDVVAGAVIGSRERLARMAASEVRNFGGALAPFEAWLVLRGVRTLGLRMRQHNEAGLCIARFLESHPRVKRVLYPGLPSHPQHELALRQMRGFSGMMGVIVEGGMEAAERFVDHLRYFGIAVSWGGFESLALPLAPNDVADGAELGVEPGFVRLSIGLEDIEDLIADLEGGLAHV